MRDAGRNRAKLGPVRPIPKAAPAPEEMVRRCIEHRPGAWDDLLLRYANLIHSTIRRTRLEPVEADEAFQKTVLTIYRTLPTLRNPDRIVPWIIGIAHNQAI